jgi:hypothetical protein
MPELTATLAAMREKEQRNNRFQAAIQGIDLDEGDKEEGMKKWEDMKAAAFSGGAASDSNDITSLQGYNAQKAGFGIGMGIDWDGPASEEVSW